MVSAHVQPALEPGGPAQVVRGSRGGQGVAHLVPRDLLPRAVVGAEQGRGVAAHLGLGRQRVVGCEHHGGLDQGAARG